MSTLIIDNTLYKPVSNQDYQEVTFAAKPLESSLVTFPQKASIVANFIERERRVARVKPIPAGAILDASVASFGNRKILEVVIADDDREQVKDVLTNPWKKIAALRIKAKNGQVFAGTGWLISPTVLASAGQRKW